VAKRRVNLYVDGEVYDRVKSLCDRMGHGFSPSSIANQAFMLFDDQFTPVFEKAIAGDKDAALQLVQGVGLRSMSELSAMLNSVHTESVKSPGEDEVA
jgi:hypothetical protein